MQSIRRGRRAGEEMSGFRIGMVCVVMGVMACHVEGNKEVPEPESTPSFVAGSERHPRDTAVDIGYVDAHGVEHHLSADVSARREVSAQTHYDGCGFDYADTAKISYRGYTVTPGPGYRTIRVSWVHAMPDGISMMIGSTSYARTRLTRAPGCGTNGAFATTPVSVTFLDSYTDTLTGLLVNRYEVAHSFQVSDADFGQYSGFSSSLRIMTDCEELGALLPSTQQDVLSPRLLLAAGDEFSLTIRPDGNVWGTGASAYGNMGDNASPSYSEPTPLKVSVVSCMKAVSTSSLAVMGLRSDGTLWGWGNNFLGQLGIGTQSAAHPTPTQLDLTQVRVVSMAFSHGIALREDGSVWTWGVGNGGKLGTGTEASSKIPVLATTPSNLITAEAGDGHSMALRADGTVWTWGWNGSGQLGDGTTVQRNLPVQTPGLSGVTAISAGANHSFALKSDGTLWAWGLNSHGQLGDGTTTSRSTPVMVQGLADVVAMSAGTRHSLALKADGTVWAWGNNATGELGDGTVVNKSSPVQVSGVEHAVAVKAGYNHSVIMRADGLVLSWGTNTYGQLGNGLVGGNLVSPTLSSLR